MRLAIDLETVPGCAPHLKQEAEDATRPPGTLKKQETIDAWNAHERPAAVLENYRKFALAPETGEIISIAAVTEDGDEFVRCRTTAEQENELLIAFYAWAAARLDARRQHWEDGAGRDHWTDAEPVHLVAHNAAFDINYLRNRSAVCGVRPSFALPAAMDRTGKGFTCTMLAWAGYGGRVSLRRLALAFGLPDPKGELDGSMVFDAWQAGRTQEIADYNLLDAKTCMAIYDRMFPTQVAA